MALDAATLIRAGGSALLAIAGLLAIALARGDRGAIALGATFLTWGSQLVGNNLLSGNEAAYPFWEPVLVVLLAARAVAMAALMVYWPAPVRPHERRFLMATFAIVALIVAIRLPDLALWRGGWSAYAEGRALASEDVSIAKDAMWTGVAILFPLRYLATAQSEGMLRRQLAWGGVLVPQAIALGRDLLASGRILGWPTIASPFLVAGVLGAAALWTVASTRPDGRPARLAALALLALGLVGLVLRANDAGEAVEDTVVGIQRSLFAFLLVLGMMRLGFLGREVTLRTAHRGTLAAAALALVFVVAQVAQNFLSASYGLLTGGVVAGAFLFAAQPIQRAVERVNAQEVEVAGAPPRREGPAAASTFKAAVRAARHDGVVSPAEELHLAEVADGLGLTPGEMVRLRHEVEAEYDGPREGARTP